MRLTRLLHPWNAESTTLGTLSSPTFPMLRYSLLFGQALTPRHYGGPMSGPPRAKSHFSGSSGMGGDSVQHQSRWAFTAGADSATAVRWQHEEPLARLVRYVIDKRGVAAHDDGRREKRHGPSDPRHRLRQVRQFCRSVALLGHGGRRCGGSRDATVLRVALRAGEVAGPTQPGSQGWIRPSPNSGRATPPGPHLPCISLPLASRGAGCGCGGGRRAGGGPGPGRHERGEQPIRSRVSRIGPNEGDRATNQTLRVYLSSRVLNVSDWLRSAQWL
jgi:hypothetical protein